MKGGRERHYVVGWWAGWVIWGLRLCGELSIRDILDYPTGLIMAMSGNECTSGKELSWQVRIELASCLWRLA